MKIKFPLFVEPVGEESTKAILAFLMQFYNTPEPIVVKCISKIDHTLYEITYTAFIALVSEKGMDAARRELYTIEQSGNSRIATRVSFEAILADVIGDRPQDILDGKKPKTLGEEFFGHRVASENIIVIEQESLFPFGKVKQRNTQGLKRSRRGR